MTALTETQLDAVCEAQDEDDALAGLSASKVAQFLKQRGHPEFAGYGLAVAEEAKPAPKAKKKRTAKAKAKAEPAPPAGDVPALEVGEVDGDTGGRREHYAGKDAYQDDKQLPAAPARQAKQLPVRPAASVGVEGMEGIDHSDLVVPRLQLKQAQTKDRHGIGIKDVPDGTWFLSNDPDEAIERHQGGDSLAVVFLEIRGGRQFLLPYEQEARDRVLEDLGLLEHVDDEVNVICSSPDRETPVARDDQPWGVLSDSCKACPHAQWRQSTRGKRMPPLCGLAYRAVAVIEDTGAPVRMFFRSSAIKPVRSLLTNLALAGKRRKVGIYGFSVLLDSVERTNDRNESYYAPKFGRPAQLEDPEDVEMFASMRAGLLDALDQHVDEDLEPAAAGEGEEA